MTESRDQQLRVSVCAPQRKDGVQMVRPSKVNGLRKSEEDEERREMITPALRDALTKQGESVSVSDCRTVKVLPEHLLVLSGSFIHIISLRWFTMTHTHTHRAAVMLLSHKGRFLIAS